MNSQKKFDAHAALRVVERRVMALQSAGVDASEAYGRALREKVPSKADQRAVERLRESR